MNAADIISTYDLKLTYAPVMENPFMTQVSADLNHYYCTLHNETTSFDFYMSLGGDYDGALTADFCLERVLEDVGSLRACAGYAEFCRLLGIEEEDGRAQLGYEEITRLSENLNLILTDDNELTIGPSI